MGGDRGSAMAIQGALAAVRDRKDLNVILLGPRTILEQQLAEHAGRNRNLLERISVHHASEVITMDDSPVDAVRKKKEATIMVGFDLVKNGFGGAVVFPGYSWVDPGPSVSGTPRGRGFPEARPVLGYFPARYRQFFPHR